MILARDTLLEISNGQSPMINGVTADLVQIDSIDLPVGSSIHRLKAAALPGPGETVAKLIEHFSSFSFDTKEKGAFLEKGACYAIPMDINLSLTSDFAGVFSPKSSTGREDVLVRVLCDGQGSYDQTPRGYCGPLYLEVTPLSFNVRVTPRLALTQMRIRDRLEALSNQEIALLHAKCGIVRDKTGVSLPTGGLDLAEQGLYMHVDLDRPIIGFEARENPRDEVYLNAKGTLRWNSFWRRLTRDDCLDGELILSPGRFYLLATRERIVVPPDICAELMVYDLQSGDFRSHYAGFFDGGFGLEADGTHGVLEVRVRDVPFRIRHGQRICKMVFERPDRVPSVYYGQGTGSHYVSSNPCLAKHYAEWNTAWVS